MKVAVIGQGGREHALAWKLARSPRVGRVFVAPGNGGTALAGGKIVNVPVEGLEPVVAWAVEARVDLVVVGPEGPLAAGLVDVLQGRGVRAFGPSRAAAQLEASKSFAKAVMDACGVPTARWRAFTALEEAVEWVEAVDFPVVVKASGLAAGKGVIVADDRAEAIAALALMLRDGGFGGAGAEVVVEERLEGPEASVMAFCDGTRLAVMPAAQDHKRAFDGDRGPNTGGMGAYAPAPVLSDVMLAEVVETVLQPVVDHMAALGAPYVGVLYAGLMLTADGPRVLEFNGRFGDPETQVVLPLLESELVDVLEACVEGRLEAGALRWSSQVAAAVVAASGGYPGAFRRGLEVRGVGAAGGAARLVFQAGTRVGARGLETDGGRVLSVTGLGATLEAALAEAYAGIAAIDFEGMHVRRDIGHRALAARAGEA